MELILALLIIALGIIFVIEIFQVRKNKIDADELKGATETYVDVYESLRGVVNINAAATRSLQAGVDRLEKAGAIHSTLVDIILEAIKHPEIRMQLESELTSNLEVESMEEDEDTNT